MRVWLNDGRSYIPPVGIGEKMRGITLATVLFSRVMGVNAGDIVLAPVPVLDTRLIVESGVV